MPRLDTLSEVMRQVLLSFPCVAYATMPWAPLQQELSRSRLALHAGDG